MKFLEKIFSIKNKDCHKIIIICGLKIKFKNKLKALEHKPFALEKENRFLIKKIFNLQKDLDLIQTSLKAVSDMMNTEKRDYQKRLQTQEAQILSISKTVGVLNREKNLVNWRFNYLIDKLGQEELKDIVLQQKFFYADNEYYLDFENPKTFNEKIHWLRKHYLLDNPLTDMISDKLQFKSYIAEKLGAEYIIPLLGQWEDPRNIDWDALPDKFVLKSNWGGDGQQVLVVKDKSKLDIPATVKKLREWIAPWGSPYYYAYTPIFKNIKPCIIAEEFVEGLGSEFYDYKFFCFNGAPKMVYVTTNWAQDSHKMSYYDINWEKMDLIYSNYEAFDMPKPDNLDKMLEIATKLSKEFPFVRVDFFDLKNRVVLSEMTFTPGGGLGKYDPVEWDYKLGEMLDISYLTEKKSA